MDRANKADFFGYVTPGNPELELIMERRMHILKNGIYGEMFVAAMLSAAAVSSDIEDIEACLSQIPSKSRLTEKIRLVTTWKGRNNMKRH